MIDKGIFGTEGNNEKERRIEEKVIGMCLVSFHPNIVLIFFFLNKKVMGELYKNEM
jgi:hypothetical protein